MPFRVLMLVLVGLPLAVTGFLDDWKNLGIVTRIVMQLLVTSTGLLVLGIFPPVVFPWGTLEVAWFLAPLYVLGLVWLINLANFMDGIDALAAAETIFYCLAVGMFAATAESGTTGLLVCGLAVAVSAFLFFNISPARLFMGDLGSNFLGYAMGILGLLAVREGVLNVWSLLILLGVFIVDATTTLLGRILDGGVWYHAHRSHAYQCAALRLGSHGRVVLVVTLINLLWLLPLAVFATRYAAWGLPATVLAWSPLVLLVLWCRRVLAPDAFLSVDVHGGNG